MESFIAMEDYSYSWIISNFFRLLRLAAMFISTMISPLYVAKRVYLSTYIFCLMLKNAVNRYQTAFSYLSFTKMR